MAAGGTLDRAGSASPRVLSSSTVAGAGPLCALALRLRTLRRPRGLAFTNTQKMSRLARTISRLRAAPRVAGKLLRYGMPRHLVLFGPVSIGDDVLCTAVLHELARRGERSLWMMSRHPNLFAHNPDVARVVPIDDHHAHALRRLGSKLTQPYYFTPGNDSRRQVPPSIPVIARMCQMTGITGEIALRPWIYLTAEERSAGRLAGRQI